MQIKREREKNLNSLLLLSLLRWDLIKFQTSVDFISPRPTTCTTITIKLLQPGFIWWFPQWFIVATPSFWLSTVLSVSPMSPLVLLWSSLSSLWIKSFLVNSCQLLFNLCAFSSFSIYPNKTQRWPLKLVYSANQREAWKETVKDFHRCFKKHLFFLTSLQKTRCFLYPFSV